MRVPESDSYASTRNSLQDEHKIPSSMTGIIALGNTLSKKSKLNEKYGIPLHNSHRLRRKPELYQYITKGS